MNLTKYGYAHWLANAKPNQIPDGFEPGRIIAEHKERYIVITSQGELDAEITGNMRFSAQSREDFPAVGDWVVVQLYDQLAIIHSILPRTSVIARQAVGQRGEKQVIATNIDMALLVQAVDRDFNINRLERYLTICHTSNIQPIIVLTKTDLLDAETLNELQENVKKRVKDIPVLAISNQTRKGFEALSQWIEAGKTYCLLGSSGVGKSTLLNNLMGKEIMRTGEISQNIHRGKHVTTHRELIVLDNGAILIDNPGMREVGIADAGMGLQATFSEIGNFAQHCRFIDCTHTTEAGCAVLKAVEDRLIDEDSYQNYLKMEREKAHYESSVAERRKRDKSFGKMMKNYKKDQRKMQ